MCSYSPLTMPPQSAKVRTHFGFSQNGGGTNTEHGEIETPGTEGGGLFKIDRLYTMYIYIRQASKKSSPVLSVQRAPV